MVQKIITAFRAKHKFNLSNERLNAYAEKWQSKIENEEAIDNFIAELDVEPLEEIAKLDDALRAPKPKPEEPKDVEPNNELEALKQQMAKMQEALENKVKTDLTTSRSEQLKDYPDELKATFKFIQLDSLSDEGFNELKTTLNSQAEVLKLKQSSANPKFGFQKTEGKITAEQAKDIANKI